MEYHEDTITTTKEHKNSLFKFVLLIIIIIFLIVYTVNRNYKKITLVSTKNNIENEVTDIYSEDNLLSKTYLYEGYKTYENIFLNIKVDIPINNIYVYECPSSLCFILHDNFFNFYISARVDTINPNGKLEDLDYFCSADGFDGRQYCTDQTVTKYTNKNGVEGYLVKNTKIIEDFKNPENNQTEYDNKIYVMPNKNGENSYIIFSIDNTAYVQEALETLDQLVDTYRIR